MEANIEIKLLTGGQPPRQLFPPCCTLPLKANGICNDARERESAHYDKYFHARNIYRQ
jgi:hypothetical protein